MAAHVTRLFMAGQSHSALGAAKILTGDGHGHQAIWRVDQIAPSGRYTLDNAGRIAEMKNRAVVEAREKLPELRRNFFDKPADKLEGSKNRWLMRLARDFRLLAI
ncbi:hypothetical protein ACOZ4Y_11465 [Komagataeibacter rhaeticus]|uniref:hypothetical protein n=1 Tax=Komagataeibacter rhaeticus TaxID=215221 RepID=UPI001969F1F7|nr:hypothetical protein [Komagataeibacter rhaeticus]